MAPFGLHFRASLDVFGFIFAPFWWHVGAMLGPSGARAGTGWVGGLREAQRMSCWLAFGEHEAAGLVFPPKITRGELCDHPLPLPLERLKCFAG